jgi:cell division protein FtsI (penicillin-binding protein 3)
MLTDSSQTDTMPDLAGLSARQATFWLASRGVEVRVDGTGMVTGQSPQAGSPLPAVAAIRCR